MKKKYDVIVIGGGSGGVRTARLSGGLYKSVLLIEREKLGGTCVNFGCIPKKMYHFGSEIFHLGSEMIGESLHITRKSQKLHWQAFNTKVYQQIAKIIQSYQSTLEKAGVDIIKGNATFVDNHIIKVGDNTIEGEKIVIATGSKPVHLTIPGTEYIHTSKDLFSLDQLPESVAIIGSGIIGIEFASILHRFGVNVTLVSRSDNVLRHMDYDISKRMTALLKERITYRVGSASKVTKEKYGYSLHINGQKPVQVSYVLSAVGRRGNYQELNIDSLGIETHKGRIVIHENTMETTRLGIYAIGDVAGTLPMLVPVALAQAVTMVENWKDPNTPTPINWDYIPKAVFSFPEIASVGLKEDEACKQYSNVAVYEYEFTPTGYTLLPDRPKVYIKIIVHISSDRVVGIHMIGAKVDEIIAGFVPAMACGVTKHTLDMSLRIHPTIGEEMMFNFQTPSRIYR